MTTHEIKKLFEAKKQFVENINEVFQIEPGVPNVAGVNYEVFMKDYGEGRVDYREWLVVHYVGGGKAPRIASGNSNSANFKVIGEMLNGGCYEDVRTYDQQLTNGYTKVELC